MTTTVWRLAVHWIGVRVTRLSLRRIGFARTLRGMRRLPRACPERISPDPRWAPEVARVSGRPYGATCLDRSVWLWLVMRLHDLDADLRIGVASSDAGVDGHSWVEYDGIVINDTPDVENRFAAFDGDPVDLVFR